MEKIRKINSIKSAPSGCLVGIDQTLVHNESLTQEDRPFSPTRSEPCQITSTKMKCHTPSSNIRKHPSSEDFNVQEYDVTILKRQV